MGSVESVCIVVVLVVAVAVVVCPEGCNRYSVGVARLVRAEYRPEEAGEAERLRATSWLIPYRLAAVTPAPTNDAFRKSLRCSFLLSNGARIVRHRILNRLERNWNN